MYNLQYEGPYIGYMNTRFTLHVTLRSTSGIMNISPNTSLIFHLIFWEEVLFPLKGNCSLKFPFTYESTNLD